MLAEDKPQPIFDQHSSIVGVFKLTRRKSFFCIDVNFNKVEPGFVGL
jgi:hypothetical protein